MIVRSKVDDTICTFILSEGLWCRNNLPLLLCTWPSHTQPSEWALLTSVFSLSPPGHELLADKGTILCITRWILRRWVDLVHNSSLIRSAEWIENKKSDPLLREIRGGWRVYTHFQGEVESVEAMPWTWCRLNGWKRWVKAKGVIASDNGKNLGSPWQWGLTIFSQRAPNIIVHRLSMLDAGDLLLRCCALLPSSLLLETFTFLTVSIIIHR